MDTELLTNPIWHATRSRQADIAKRVQGAARYHPDVSPMAALEEPRDIDALKPLVDVGDAVALYFAGDTLPANTGCWQEVATIPVNQMIWQSTPVDAEDNFWQYLTEADDARMFALARATDPGPFAAQTRLMGRYLGVFDDGNLVAMAGERMRLEGWTEISGVCTQSQARGRGYASRLVRQLLHFLGQEQTDAFLHVRTGSPSERSATHIYESLGFYSHALNTVRVMQRLK